MSFTMLLDSRHLLHRTIAQLPRHRGAATTCPWQCFVRRKVSHLRVSIQDQRVVFKTAPFEPAGMSFTLSCHGKCHFQPFSLRQYDEPAPAILDKDRGLQNRGLKVSMSEDRVRHFPFAHGPDYRNIRSSFRPCRRYDPRRSGGWRCRTFRQNKYVLDEADKRNPACIADSFERHRFFGWSNLRARGEVVHDAPHGMSSLHHKLHSRHFLGRFH